MSTFFTAFMDELEKLAKKKEEKGDYHFSLDDLRKFVDQKMKESTSEEGKRRFVQRRMMMRAF